MNPTILTHSGFEFNFLDTDGLSHVFQIDDIAHALSNLCRFTGHTRSFYSVAQHSYLVSTLVPPEHALAGLLHDAAEAYLGDVSTPLKRLLPAYKEIERRIEAGIFAQFGLPADLPACVKQADRTMLATEMRDLMPNHGDLGYDVGRPCATLVVRPQTPEMAKAFFLARFEELRK